MREELYVAAEHSDFVKNKFHFKMRVVESRNPYQLHIISVILSRVRPETQGNGDFCCILGRYAKKVIARTLLLCYSFRQ